VKNYIFGGFGGIIATCIVQPIDIMKTRIQIASQQAALGKNVSTRPLDICKEIVKDKGFKAFYAGLGGGVLRQITYGTVRMGVYNSLEERYKRWMISSSQEYWTR